ncbi:MAG: methyltransferase domain-containing protein, partial [Deferrisomatales bacterium]
LPAAALEAFVGAAALALEVSGPPGDLVLDLGCGAGVDTLTLAQRGYRVLALDASSPMLRRLAGAAAGPVWPVRGRLPRLPVRAGAAGWALLNGVANLVPARGELLAEVRRALRPGGTLLVADLLAVGEVPPELRELPEAWAWCIGGAASPEQWARDLEGAGFGRPEIEALEPIPPYARARLRATAR